MCCLQTRTLAHYYPWVVSDDMTAHPSPGSWDFEPFRHIQDAKAKLVVNTQHSQA